MLPSSLTQLSEQKIPRWLTRAGNALLMLALVIMLLHVLIYVAFGFALIPFPFDYDQAEGFELNNAILLAQGGCPYCDNNVFPFYASGYTPFFHILMIPFVWLFGAQFWYGRLIIFIATFITASAIFYAVRRETCHTWTALLAGMAFLASNYIYHIGPLLRQHLLMVMLETLAVVIIANAFDTPPPGKRRRLMFAFSLLLLAGYTKQLAISTCAAVALWAFLRHPRTAIIYTMGLSIAAGLIFAGWMLATDGQWWVNIITSNQNPYITEQFTGLLAQFLRLHGPLMLMSGLIVLYELYFSRLSVYSVWFVISFASTVGAGKWGAGDSYFATTIAATCILAGIFAARTFQGRWHFPANYIMRRFSFIFARRPSATPPFQIDKESVPVGTRSASSVARLIGIVLFILYGITVIKFPTSNVIFEPLAKLLNIAPAPGHRYPLYDAAGWTVGYAVTGHFPSPADYDNGWHIVERSRNAPGYVMSEDAGFMFLAGRPVITNAVQLRNLWELQLYDPTGLIQLIENHEFGLIIRRADFFPPPVLVAINTYYQLDEIIPMNGFDYQLWIPRIDSAP